MSEDRDMVLHRPSPGTPPSLVVPMVRTPPGSLHNTNKIRQLNPVTPDVVVKWFRFGYEDAMLDDDYDVAGMASALLFDYDRPEPAAAYLNGITVGRILNA